jgi:hypothetical protein
MLLRVFLFLSLGCVLSCPARAQDKVEVFGGYSFMHYSTTPSFNPSGWELSAQYKLFRWLGAFGDIDGHYGTFEGVSSTMHDYLVGPQVSWPARISPFAHVMVGEGHFSGGGVTSSSLASGFGFGVDAKVARMFSWRVVQFDIVHTHLFNTGQSNTRVSTGIVVRF